MYTRTMRLALALAAALVALGGCATVHPWEREDLTRIEQKIDSDPCSGYETHLWMVREGALGGSGKPGGGCGCN